MEENQFDQSVLELEAGDVEHQVASLEATLTSLDALRDTLKASGVVSKMNALAIESIAPGAISELCNINGFTQLPTRTNFELTLEAVEKAKVSTFGNILNTLWKLIKKLFSWIIGLLKSNKDIVETTPKIAAQAVTAGLAATQMLTASQVETPEELALKYLVQPTLSASTVAVELLLSSDKEGVVDLENYERLQKVFAEFSATAPYGVYKALEKQITDLIETGRVPQGAFGRLLIEFGASTGQRIHYRPIQTEEGELLEPVGFDYDETSQALLKYLSECVAKPTHNGSFADPRNWLDESFIVSLDLRISRVIANLRLPADADKRLGKIEKLVEDYFDKLRKDKDGFSQEEMDRQLACARFIQKEIQLANTYLSRLLNIIDCMNRFFRAVEQGYTKMVEEITKDAEGAERTALKKIYDTQLATHKQRVANYAK